MIIYNTEISMNLTELAANTRELYTRLPWDQTPGWCPGERSSSPPTCNGLRLGGVLWVSASLLATA